MLPPKGVSTIQGDFLSPSVQHLIKEFLADPDRGRPRTDVSYLDEESYIDRERREAQEYEMAHGVSKRAGMEGHNETEGKEARSVDVVLSDMWEPWPLIGGSHKRSLTGPYRRMMNTSGIRFKDHAGSMVRPFHIHILLIA